MWLLEQFSAISTQDIKVFVSYIVTFAVLGCFVLSMIFHHRTKWGEWLLIGSCGSMFVFFSAALWMHLHGKTLFL